MELQIASDTFQAVPIYLWELTRHDCCTWPGLMINSAWKPSRTGCCLEVTHNGEYMNVTTVFCWSFQLSSHGSQVCKPRESSQFERRQRQYSVSWTARPAVASLYERRYNAIAYNTIAFKSGNVADLYIVGMQLMDEQWCGTEAPHMMYQTCWNFRNHRAI